MIKEPGGAFALNNIGGLTLGAIAAFLQMSKSVSNPVSQVSQQVNAVVMALAGAKRIFQLMDAPPEEDHGYVTLVKAREKDGVFTETTDKNADWTWKYPHKDGTVTYTPLTGDVRMFDVDFGYSPGKTVLHDIAVYAKPGQKVAFVGAQRLSTVQNADVIMVLDHGRIIERGNHNELMKEGNTYYQLYTGAFELE